MKKFLFLLIKKYRVTVLLLLILALSCGILAPFITSTESEIINMVIRRFSEGRFQAGFGPAVPGRAPEQVPPACVIGPSQPQPQPAAGNGWPELPVVGIHHVDRLLRSFQSV